MPDATFAAKWLYMNRLTHQMCATVEISDIEINIDFRAKGIHSI